MICMTVPGDNSKIDEIFLNMIQKENKISFTMSCKPELFFVVMYVKKILG